jgi:hypothetical protein
MLSEFVPMIFMRQPLRSRETISVIIEANRRIACFRTIRICKRTNRIGPTSNLFTRIQFAFAFDMVHSDVLLALDKLRGYRNKIAHTWDQNALPDFVETPLPYMDEMESAFLHINIKDGGDGDLSAEGSLRLRTVWLLARLFYETRNYTLAKMAKLNPYKALYGEGSPKALGTALHAAYF